VQPSGRWTVVSDPPDRALSGSPSRYPSAIYMRVTAGDGLRPFACRTPSEPDRATQRRQPVDTTKAFTLLRPLACSRWRRCRCPRAGPGHPRPDRPTADASRSATLTRGEQGQTSCTASAAFPPGSGHDGPEILCQAGPDPGFTATLSGHGSAHLGNVSLMAAAVGHHSAPFGAAKTAARDERGQL